MGCGYSVYSEKDDIIFKHKGPSRPPTKVIKMFKKENGLLFRLEFSPTLWGFYNDTKEYEFHIKYIFETGSDIEALEEATLTELEDGSIVVETVIYPLETQMFIDGDINGGRGRVEAQPLSERYKREKIKEKIQKGK